MLGEFDIFKITVFYAVDNEEFQRGYAKLSGYCRNVSLIRDDPQKSIVLQLLDVLRAGTFGYCSILDDDDVFVRPISLSDAPFPLLDADTKISAISTRLHPNVTYCQPLAIDATPPRVNRHGVFRWKMEAGTIRARIRRRLGLPPIGGGDWDCKMSVDGNIYRRADLLRCLEGLPRVTGVGYLEPAIENHPIPSPFGVCYPIPRLINVPLNRVDVSRHTYPSMGESAAAINRRFLQGERIEGYEGAETNVFASCHIELAPIWRRQ